MNARDRILRRVTQALESREPIAHPGEFQEWGTSHTGSATDTFLRLFQAAGGRTVRVNSDRAAREWLDESVPEDQTVTFGAHVPDILRPLRSEAPPESASVGISMARGAAGETGTVILGSEDGRKIQILPPTHVVIVRGSDICRTLHEALKEQKTSLPSGLGLHSGPSKSADIGQIVVRGVHGPGHVTALVIE